MAGGGGNGDDIISGINVTPLVDVVLVILIIFIVTASFVFRNTIPIELPKAQTGEQTAAGLLNLAVNEAGELFINGRPGTLDGLPAAVAEARNRAGQGGAVSAFVSADRRARYGDFATVVDRLRLAGVADIALDTQPEEVREAE